MNPKLFDKIDILKKLVAENGSCCWSSPSICKKCPLSQLKRKVDGNAVNCIEALGIENMSEEEADARYQEVAERLLLDETIDQILEDVVDGTDKQ